MAVAQHEATLTQRQPSRCEANDVLQSSPREALPTWARITQELASIEALPDDWDGGGGEAIAPVVIQRCRDLLLSLRAQGKDCPRSVRPTPDAAVVFEWAYGPVRIEAELSVDSTEWMEWLPGRPVDYSRFAWPK
ncbi:MAG TPA: hypothetical protein VHY91_19300 [Pirellulales bacterium]|jgi:hypothetical protein|nr:hypothetical protein [Pirellulales bacterium]